MDDLVFSGAGSGCNNEDDEDECPPLPEMGSGDDDLITPVYVPATKPPATTKTPHTSTQGPGGKPCDDEDCFPGSGSGEITLEETTVTFQGTGISIYRLDHTYEYYIVKKRPHQQLYNTLHAWSRNNRRLGTNIGIVLSYLFAWIIFKMILLLFTNNLNFAFQFRYLLNPIKYFRLG